MKIIFYKNPVNPAGYEEDTSKSYTADQINRQAVVTATNFNRLYRARIRGFRVLKENGNQTAYRSIAMV